MRGLEFGNRLGDHIIAAHQLHLELLHVFQLAQVADVRIGALDRSELSAAASLETTGFITADAPCAAGEDGLLDGFGDIEGNEESQFVHETLQIQIVRTFETLLRKKCDVFHALIGLRGIGDDGIMAVDILGNAFATLFSANERDITMLKWLAIVLMGLFGLLQYSLWFGEGGLSELAHIRSRTDALAAENAVSLANNQRLAAEVVDLKNGLDAIEERARSDIGMVREDEQFFWVPDAKAQVSSSSTGGGQ